MVKVTFDNKPAQGKTAPVSPTVKAGGGVSIAFPNGVKKKGSIQTTPYQKALDEAIEKAAAERGSRGTVGKAAFSGNRASGKQQKYSVGKGIAGAAMKGVNQAAQGIADTLALVEDAALAPFELLSGQQLGDLSDSGLANQLQRRIRNEGQETEAKYAENIKRGGKAAEIFDKYGASTVAAVPQVVAAMLTSGASLGATSTTLAKTAATEMTPSIANTIRNSVFAMGKDPQYWLSFSQVVGSGYEQAIDDMKKSGVDNNTARTKAALYAVGNGLMNAAVEVGGGIQTLPEQLKHGSAAWKAWLESAIDEGKEEVVQGILERATQNVAYRKNNPLASLSDENAVLNPLTSAKEFLGGAVVGGVLGAGQVGVNSALNAMNGRNVRTEAAPTVERPVTPEVEQKQAQRQNTAPVQTIEQQDAAPAQPAPTPESAQGTGGGNLVPTQPNAAQGAAEGKADALDAGKRVNLLEYSNEQNKQKVEDGLNNGTLAVDAKENIYRVDEDQHIDRRDSVSVGERSVNAFQFDHPELHSYYADAAAVLQEEMSFAQKGGELIRRTSREAGDDEYIRTKRGVSERIVRLLDDEGVRYDDIDRSLSAIIHNHGQENFAAAKRVELLLDDMLTNGYTDIHGQRIAPNEEYIATKKAIPGADMSERTHEELPIYDMPEGQNGGIYGRQEENAGRPELADAAERGTPGEADAARALSDGAAERGERGGNGRESGRIPREVRNIGGEDGNALTVRRRQEASGISQFISPREANVPNGASGDNTVTIFDEADWDQELISAAEWAKSKGVKKVTALLGVIKVERDGKTGRIFGAFNADTGEIFVNAGSLQRSVSETIEHETAHYLAEAARRENVRAFMRDVQSRYSSEEWGKVYDAYFDRYAALTGDYAGMSESGIELYVWEEIMGDAYAEIDQYDEKASQFNREAESALSQSGQESESTLQSEGAQSAAEQGRETAAATERRTGPPERYSVEETDDGRAVAVVDDGILSGIDTQTWDKTKKAQAKAAAKAALLTFKDGIQVNGIDYKVNRTSRREYTRSEDTERLYHKDRGAFVDKMRAAANADDIITATADWTRDGTLTHPRTDNFVDFAHGNVLIQSGNNQYDARVVVGITSGGEYVFYDVVDMEPTSFAKKEEAPTTALSNKALGDIHGASLDDSISKDGKNVKSPTLGDEIRRQTMGEETAPFKTGESPAKDVDTGGAASSEESVSDSGGNVKPKTRYSVEDETDSTGRELTEQQREYFKDSEVRDEDGRLIPVYHGSQAQFTEFSADFMSMHGSMEGQGFYFTDNRSMAGGYKRDGGQLPEGYLNISKPLSDSEVTMTKAELKKLLKEVDPTGDDVVINYDPTGGMGYPSKAWYNRALAATVEQIYSTSDSDSEILADVANSGAGAGATTKAARKALGYDGYIVKGKYDDATVYVAFESNQFKNADNKTPTENQDIRFSAGGDAALQRRRDRADAELDRNVDENDLTAQNDAAERLNQSRRDTADAELADEEIDRQERSYEKAERDGMRTDFPSISAEWKTKLERARTAATNNIKPSGFDSYDAYLDALDKQRAADRAERLRVKSRDEFKGTKALDELGVKIANSAGIYHNTEQLIANDRAAKSIQNATRRAEQRLGATRQEKTIARDIANGERSMSDIPHGVKKSRVLELADYYTAQKATKTGLLQQQRIEINDALREQARELIRTEAPEINRKGLRKLFDPSKGLVLYHRTPQRIMRALFGWKQGQQINEAVFEPVYENEQERKRFINRMFDEVRTFEGADGKKSALNKDESAFAQRLKEGRTVEELVEKSGAAESIRAAAENLKNGAEMKDAAREFSLNKGSRDLARQYADWLQTQDDYAAAKNVDRTKVENAIEKYTELYDKLYAAINDFLVAHGYEPIGFIKGYAPHFQTSEANGKLESALKAIGVDLGSGVGKLPTSIAGLTKSFKPNKRYNPFFQHRRGSETDYDIVKGFETYVDYASDVLYHTDDIMRVRQMANYLRSTFAPEEMKADIDQMEAMRYAPADVKEEYLRDKGKLTGDTFLGYEDLTNLMEQYTDEKYRSIEDATEFSDLVSWMDDYANKLAGKQLFEDRAMEREVGREELNGAKKLNRMFARANVAGNLSSALNQTAQLPMIATELGQKYTWRAVGDILNGKTTGMSAFRGESDFLTEKSGIDYIQSTKGEKALEKLFSPLEKVDTLVSTIAVRGKYRMELDAGKSPKEAMKAADRWARDIMGTRSKGSVPLTFQSKNLIAQMLNMFQVEAANTFEHVTQDRLGPGFKEMAAKIGKDKAIKKLASDAIAYMLLAFLLNRLDEDAYGGTPAPFDVLGMGLNAVASGNGLTSSDMLKMITDDVTEKFFGERLFDTDPNGMNDEFDGWSAAEDTLYNVSNDVPYVRNVAGLVGWGDQTLPMPDLWGTATGIGKTLKKQATGKFDSSGEFWSEVGRQLMGLAGDTLPGGRQLEKSAQGIEALARGGSYRGSGDSKGLQYPVGSPLEDPFEALRAALFGKNALSESRAYWAAGGNALSASQTALYQELVDSGMSRKKAYETIRDFNDATADLEADRDENGNPVSGSKKEKVVEAINKLPLSRKQKDKLYLSKNYSEKDLGEMPWN